MTKNFPVTNNLLTIFNTIYLRFQISFYIIKQGPRSKNPSGSASKDNFQKSQAKWSSGGSAVRSAPVGGAGAASPAAEIFEEEEDPCIICHEELMPHDTCKLECQHRFHNQVRLTSKIKTCLFGFNVAFKHLRSYHDDACL